MTKNFAHVHTTIPWCEMYMHRNGNISKDIFRSSYYLSTSGIWWQKANRKVSLRKLNKHIPFLLGSARIKHSSLLYFSHSNEEPSTTYKYATHGKYRVIIISGEISSSTEQSHTPSPSRPCNHFSGRLISFLGLCLWPRKKNKTNRYL